MWSDIFHFGFTNVVKHDWEPVRCEKVIKHTTIIIINGEYWIHTVIHQYTMSDHDWVHDEYTKQETNKNIRFRTGHWQNINHECITQTLLSPFFYFFTLRTIIYSNTKFKIAFPHLFIWIKSWCSCFVKINIHIYIDYNSRKLWKSLWSATSSCMFQQRSMDSLANGQIDFTVITFIWDYDLFKGIA